MFLALVNVGFDSIARMDVTTNRKTFNFTALDGNGFLAADISTIKILDDVGIALEDGKASYYEFQVSEIHAKKQFAFEAAPDNMTRWSTLKYDPTFAAFLNQDILPSPSPIKKDNKATKIAIAVSLSLVAVLVIAVAVAFTMVPSLRKMVRPFSDREKKDRERMSAEKSGRWTPGVVERT